MSAIRRMMIRKAAKEDIYKDYISVFFEVASDTTQNIFSNRSGQVVDAVLDGVAITLPASGQGSSQVLTAGTHTLKLKVTGANRLLMGIDNIVKVVVPAESEGTWYRGLEISYALRDGFWWYRSCEIGQSFCSSPTNQVLGSTLYVTDYDNAVRKSPFSSFAQIVKIE